MRSARIALLNVKFVPGLEEGYEDTYTASAEQEQKNRRLALQ